MGKMLESLSEDQKEIIKVFENGCADIDGIVERTGFYEAKVERVLDELIEMGLIYEKVV